MQRFGMVLSFVPLLAVGPASAHPGHGDSTNGLWHYLTEPGHLLGMVAVVLGVGGLAYALRRLRRHYV